MTNPPLLWKFLLAVTIPQGYNPSKLPYPLYVSPKIDGVRGGVQNCGVVSRNGRPIANKMIQTKFGRSAYEGLDFEITDGAPYGPDVYNRAMRMCNKSDADASNARLNVFGMYEPDACRFSTTLALLQESFGDQSRYGIHIVKQTLIKTAEQLTKFEEKCLAQGYEGVMLRRIDSPAYPQKVDKKGQLCKDNRSTMNEGWLMKLKRFDYAEAHILAVHPLEHNLNTDTTSVGRKSSKKSGVVIDAHQFGSVDVVDTKSKSTFSMTIPTNELRRWDGWRTEKLWKNKVIRYKFFPTGNVKAPRFPTAEFQELLP